jgi:polyisoprenyl-phosphate glycosyltransferase
MAHPLISVVVPVYNEKDNIEPLLARLYHILKDYNHEIFFVSDGSRDGTDEEIKKIAEKDKKVKFISFNRNFGHQMALTAGYMYAKGDCVVSIDADLQDPPEIIPEMIEKWKNGARIVYAKRSKREGGDNFFKRTTARLFYSFINFLSDTPVPDDVGDFRLLDKKVVQFLNDLPEQSRFLRGLVAWGGYPVGYVHFERERRHAGETHYPFSKMVNFALEGITSFSTKPLRMTIYLGFLTSLFSIIVIIYKVIEHTLFPEVMWLPGWASLFFAVVFLGGVQLITIGIIGEYISKIYKEVQGRPQYIIKDTVNV